MLPAELTPTQFFTRSTLIGAGAGALLFLALEIGIEHSVHQDDTAGAVGLVILGGSIGAVVGLIGAMVMRQAGRRAPK